MDVFESCYGGFCKEEFRIRPVTSISDNEKEIRQEVTATCEDRIMLRDVAQRRSQLFSLDHSFEVRSHTVRCPSLLDFEQPLLLSSSVFETSTAVLKKSSLKKEFDEEFSIWCKEDVQQLGQC